MIANFALKAFFAFCGVNVLLHFTPILRLLTSPASLSLVGTFYTRVEKMPSGRFWGEVKQCNFELYTDEMDYGG